MYINNDVHPWVNYFFLGLTILVIVMAILGLVSSVKYLFKSVNKSNDIVAGSQAGKSLIKQPKFWYTLLLLGISVYVINFAFKILGL